MPDINAVFAIENLGLGIANRNELFATIQGLGLFNDSDQPNRRNHWRTRPDNDAALHHGYFDSSKLSITSIKNFLAALFDVPSGEIDHATANATFADRATRIVTFSRLGTDYLRLDVMGYAGTWPTNEQSLIEARAYVSNNAIAWGEIVDP